MKVCLSVPIQSGRNVSVTKVEVNLVKEIYTCRQGSFRMIEMSNLNLHTLIQLKKLIPKVEAGAQNLWIWPLDSY